MAWPGPAAAADVAKGGADGVNREQRNILFLFTDQHRIDTLGCYGNSICRTPHIDSLSAEGVRFDQAYTPTAICTPARATLVTGLLPFRHTLIANFERNVGYREELPDDLIPFSRYLRQAGYRTGNVGQVARWQGERTGGVRV